MSGTSTGQFISNIVNKRLTVNTTSLMCDEMMVFFLTLSTDVYNRHLYFNVGFNQRRVEQRKRTFGIGVMEIMKYDKDIKIRLTET